jgi:rhodanese-related sulfurtransferase
MISKIFINKKVIFLCFLIPLVFFSCKEKAMTSLDLVKSAEQIIKSVSVDEAKGLLKKKTFTIIDVRTKEEFDKAHIVNAIHISRGLLEFEIEQKVRDKNTYLLIYCQVGGRSALAVKELIRMGYKNLYNLKGGYLLWLQ